MSAPSASVLPAAVEPPAASVARPGPSYWHGGAPGLAPGGWILPPSVTGTRETVSAWMSAHGRALSGVRADRVYVTPDADAASLYAALHPRGGWVYLVLPEGPLEVDPDCSGEPGLSWACPRALVVQAFKLHPAHVAQVRAALLGGAA